jgi:hypothetical protein
MDFLDFIIEARLQFCKSIAFRDSATSMVMKRAKYNKQSASRKMGWMSFLDSKMMEEEV